MFHFYYEGKVDRKCGKQMIGRKRGDGGQANYKTGLQ